MVVSEVDNTSSMIILFAARILSDISKSAFSGLGNLAGRGFFTVTHFNMIASNEHLLRALIPQVSHFELI